jgi:putative Mn2+ efflux pump MntP
MKSTVHFITATVVFVLSFLMSTIGPHINDLMVQAWAFIAGWAFVVAGWIVFIIGFVHKVRGD